MKNVLLAFILLASFASGCGEEKERAPRASFPGDRTPPPGSSGTPPSTPTVDAGLDGTVIGGPSLRAGCVALDESSTDNRVFVDPADGEPARILFDRGYAGYDPATCGPEPRFVIALAFGECVPRSSAHFVISMPAAAVGVAVAPGTVPVNFNPLVTVRYLDPATGSYSNCEGAGGYLLFEELNDTPGAPVRGTFLLELPDCANPAREPVALNGSFALNVGDALETVCPDEPPPTL